MMNWSSLQSTNVRNKTNRRPVTPLMTRITVPTITMTVTPEKRISTLASVATRTTEQTVNLYQRPRDPELTFRLLQNWSQEKKPGGELLATRFVFPGVGATESRSDAQSKVPP
jgi:hypothetical protein